MRGVASIRKSDGSAISFAELQKLVAGDPEFQLGPDAAANAEAINAVWSPFFDDPREPRVHFRLSAGVIAVKNPPREALRKMQDLAAKLGARVVDREGQDITDREFPDLVTTEGCFRWATILLVLALAGLAWLVLGKASPAQEANSEYIGKLLLLSLVFLLISIVGAIQRGRIKKGGNPFAFAAVVIGQPRDGAVLEVPVSDPRPNCFPVSGRIVGVTPDDLSRADLQVEVVIRTDALYPQGKATVAANGHWLLPDVRFGGDINEITVVLIDSAGTELATAHSQALVRRV